MKTVLRLFILFILILFYIIFQLPLIKKFYKFVSKYKDHESRFESYYLSKCDLPLRMDPFDPVIKKFIKNLNSTMICHKKDDGTHDLLYNLSNGQSLSYMNDFDPIVRIMKIHGYGGALKCLYEPFYHVDGDDDDVDFPEKKPIIGNKLNLEKIEAEFVNIECYLKDKLVYTNIHSWPSRVPSHFEVTSLNAVTKPSVMFLVIESMSYLNFKRFMVKTNEALSKLSNNFILRGLNKMADNSFPNMMPLLSGYRPYYGDWPFDLNGPYDDIQFIWKDFKSQNYTTGYIEDHPLIGLFNYLAFGFKKAPTDWYPRPYWLKMAYDQRHNNEYESFCYKQKPKIIYWLKQMKQFLNKVNKTKKPFFLWSFYIQVTHDDFNNAQLIDGYIADFINSYRYILENTVFIIMGDHGNRFGPSAKTEYGQIESRMPLFNLHIPTQQLLQKHQHLSHYLKINEQKLTTWLDVREMLKDVVSGTYQPIVSSSKRSAYSVWREEVPADRTCEDALIPLEFCLCWKRLNVQNDSELAEKAATVLITKLNQALAEYRHLCHELSLKSIHRLQILQSSGESNLNDRLDIVLSADPSNGLFQAQLYLKNSTSMNNSSFDDWIIEGDISRLDAYRNQSSCIDDRVLRKYCYCR